MERSRQRASPARLTLFATVASVALGVAVRWRFGLAPAAGFDSDEAVTGLVARAALDGHPTVFYPSQEYGGTPGAIPVTIAQAVLGRSFVALRIAAFVESVALMGMVALLVRRSALPHRAALAVIALWPLGFVAFSVREMLFYNGVLLACTGAWLLVLAPPTSPRRDVGGAIAIGLLSGLAMWATPQAVILLWPCIALYVVRNVRCRRWSVLVGAAVAALVGIGPWLVRNVRTGFASLDPSRLGTDHPTYARRVLVSARALVFQPFGDVPTRAADLLPDNPWTLTLGIAFVVLVAVTSTRRPDKLALAVLVAFPLVAALNPLAGAPAAQYRYAFIAWPALVVVCAQVVGRDRRLAVVLGVVLLGGATLAWRHQLPWVERRNAVAAAIGRELADRDLDTVLASYWDAYTIDYLCDGCPDLVPFAFRRELPDSDPAPGTARHILTSDEAPLATVTRLLDDRDIAYDVVDLSVSGFALVRTAEPVSTSVFATGELGP